MLEMDNSISIIADEKT